MTTIISKLTGTENLITNIATVFLLSVFIFSTIIGVCKIIF
jgi:hypothetical protein